MSLILRTTYILALSALLTGQTQAQFNSGSTGADGALDLSALERTYTNIVINMADHPTGIYNYTRVRIPDGVYLSFLPNSNNTPVVWLVQSDCVISGQVSVAAQGGPLSSVGLLGGPGGFAGGNGGGVPCGGQGPGGGGVGAPASYGSLGATNCVLGTGATYGNPFLVPLLGGSGGGGVTNQYGGGGGGGAILIAASGTVEISGGGIYAAGSHYSYYGNYWPGGSGGAVRIVATTISGTGWVSAPGGSIYCTKAGSGRIRFDAYSHNYAGSVDDLSVFSQGSQFVLFPTQTGAPRLSVTSVGGVAVSPSPTGQIATPDAILSAQQGNPVSIIVQCQNIPLNSLITVTVRPANGPPVSATGYNTNGTASSSTATVNVVIPRGGGTVWATATTTP